MMRHAPLQFSAAIRHVVEESLIDACAFQGWALGAVNCRTNHLHAIVFTTDSRRVVVRRLKDRSTRAVRARGLIGTTQPLWARGGSGRYLWDEHDSEAAGTYVLEAQGPPLPGTILWRDV